MPGKWGGARRARPPLDPPMVANKASNSAIHKAAGLTVSQLCLVLFHHSIIPLKNVLLGVYGSRRQERPPETVLYGSRQSGGFVNRAVNSKSTDLDWFYSIYFWKLKLLIRDLLFTTFMKNPLVKKERRVINCPQPAHQPDPETLCREDNSLRFAFSNVATTSKCSVLLGKSMICCCYKHIQNIRLINWEFITLLYIN